MNDNETTIIKELLKGDFAKGLIQELGIESDTSEAQAAFIDLLGKAAMERVTLEILKILPKDERPTYDAFIRSGDITGFRTFLSKYIPDLDHFILEQSQKEYESIKSEMHMILQGVDRAGE